MHSRLSPIDDTVSFPGSTKVLAMIAAMILGGVAIRIFKPSARAICLWMVFADILNISVLVAAIYLPCDNWRLGGTSYRPDRRFVSLPLNQNSTSFEP